MKRVEGKVALVTGGARGIGAETARLLAHEGAKVIITDILEEEGKKIASSFKGDFYYHDVSQENEWISILNTLKKKYKRLDILFNNAGIIGLDDHQEPQDPEHMPYEMWQMIHKINLDSVFFGCKYGISLMKETGGSIINMSSRSGIVGVPSTSAYASSKAAIRNYTKCVALYCAEKGYNIRCNSLHPAAILTPLWDSIIGKEDGERKKNIESLKAGIPLGFMGTPRDVAYAVLYLGSDESRYITGTEVVLDGGILAGSSACAQKTKK